MRNILVAALSLIVFETFGALPAGTMLKFENPDQMIGYITTQTREREHLRGDVLQAIVAGIKDHELEKQKQFHDCLNYFSALPSEQFEQFNGKPHPLTWHMDYPVIPTLMENAEEIKKLLGELPELPEEPNEQQIIDLINKVLLTKDDNTADIDFMTTLYKKFAEAEDGSIARRVFKKIGKGKRTIDYMPRIIGLQEWSSALEQLCDPSYHIEEKHEEEIYIKQMAKRFEDFKSVESNTSCAIV